ncbi:NAD-dependent epimerase/dehydratase family protein [Jidongwangia harbinensis]|uniref:NAD-dependent epimerase/dehydratase family protein n=1 Tax=Jidongwangia harbinensis TaxID=2878561 RepID=UPI001CD97548|nr:NAD(P)-dependent oxidoreductase [Jidongwangia harbinensis]MCA2213275.1 NAD(P)-dependent oxidoreductase [Jidongwangia harbinensis]
MGERIAVIGASGFIGGAVIARLEKSDHAYRSIRAPRLRWQPELPTSVDTRAPHLPQQEIDSLAAALSGADVVINAAGMAKADSPATPDIFGANALMPLVAARAAAAAGVPRYIHVSSISVQANDRLDESDRVTPFSAYSLSRAIGERLLLTETDPNTVIYRPAGVHGPRQSNTRAIVTIAQSLAACVAGDGSNPTPQALVEETAEALLFVSRFAGPVPRILLHPHNGMTTGSLLRILGGKEPIHLPYRPTRTLVTGLLRSTRTNIRLHSNARRLEMLLCGRDQDPTWLSQNGYAPPLDTDQWTKLALAVRGDSAPR